MDRRALRSADWDGLRASAARDAAPARQAARHRGRQLHRADHRRAARVHRITVEPEGCVDVVIGTLSSGQGHETSFAQLRDGMARRAVRVHAPAIQGDTDVVAGRRRLAFRPLDAHGRHRDRQGVQDDGSRQGQADRCPRAGSRREHDIEFTGGAFTVQGTDRSIGLFEVAREAIRRNDLPDDLRGPLGAPNPMRPSPVGGFPYRQPCLRGRDRPRTGDDRDRRLRRASTTSAARSIRCILHGQTHGGIAQGDRAGACSRDCLYDPGERPGAVGLVHGLRHAAGRRCCPRSPPRSARCCRRSNPLRRPRRRRRRHHAGARRGGQCGGRRPQGVRRHAHGNAGDPRAGLARDRCRGNGHPFPLNSAPTGIHDRSRLWSWRVCCGERVWPRI